jgi:hypothetical protein
MTATDDYGRHEALHMSSFLMDAVARALMEHLAVEAIAGMAGARREGARSAIRPVSGHRGGALGAAGG